MISHHDACALIDAPSAALPELLVRAGELRDRGRGRTVTFSAKVFVPLTTLCRDYCGYCTFRRDPGEAGAHTMEPEEVVALAQAGARLGAKEALFSLGDKPEALFASHREFLRRHGHRVPVVAIEAVGGRQHGQVLVAGQLPHELDVADRFDVARVDGEAVVPLRCSAARVKIQEPVGCRQHVVTLPAEYRPAPVEQPLGGVLEPHAGVLGQVVTTRRKHSIERER